MASAGFRGIFPYFISPIDASTGQVRERALRALVDHLIASGVHGLSPLGSTGEFAYLTAEQRAELVRIVVDAAAGRVPVVPGVAAFATDDARRQAERYLRLGAQGLVLMLQAFFPVSRAGIERYFQTVAEAVDAPICLYSNPGLTVDLPPAVVGTLSHVPNIQYYKEASGNTGRILTVMNLVGDRMQMFSASAHIPLVVFQLGGVGWMAGPACLIPAECVRLWELSQAGQWAEALRLQRRLWRINEAFQKHSLAACVKAGLQVQGFDVGDPIAPQEPLTRAVLDDVRASLAEAQGTPA
ncbi:MAG TPA: dihydrodipicolinate synthase family protein [Chloroflexota bacterium]|nr:dihydrodipicolinate synthase family protein [Chloroflexota bacterium]